MKKPSIGIIGVGNPLRKDDGIGIILLQYLQKDSSFFSNLVSFIDGGTGGLNLLYLMNRFNKVLILDAVDFKGQPGECKFFSIDEIKSEKHVSRVSTHNEDLFQIIRFGQEMNECPNDVFVFGVQPADVCFGEGLTEELQKKLDTIVSTLKKKLKKVIEE